jgi:isoamylase
VFGLDKRVSLSVWPGRAFPLGATASAGGTNFAVASEVAEAVELCVIGEGDGGRRSEERLALREYDAGVWHGFVPGLGVGTRYGFRVHGPNDAARGLRCNPAKLLLDPYAKAVHGELAWDERIFGYSWSEGPDSVNQLDSLDAMPLSVVVDPASGLGSGSPPHTPYADTLLYETHVKGFTVRHPDIPEELRGTYAGLGHPAAVDYLVRLGITAVEVLPVHQSVTSATLRQKGLSNYWGYDTISFLAPHAAYSAAVCAGNVGGQVAEFQAMVAALHDAGIEIVLDVVFNHTAEGNEYGPTLCHRGVDNAAYYRLVENDPGHYYDTTGTGNSLNVANPICLRMILDSLRYWATYMHVDGFRFDLAATLGREAGGFAATAAFFDLVDQDPVLSQLKLIAEPWDVGQADSYDLGRFPAQWSEWNGRYRDTVRDFWRSVDGTLADFTRRISGSADLFGGSRRRPSASVNILTTHDGFTLRDLVSYDTKHNDGNGEQGRDGSDDNRSWNCGVEGPTDDPDVLALRQRQQRALLATLLLSLGVPMILGGDEMGRSQRGNNNAYCQDNETSWFNWEQADTELLAWTRKLIALRRAHPALRRRRYLTGARGEEVGWFTPNGKPMTDAAWNDPFARSVAVLIDGSAEPDRDQHGMPMLDDDLLFMVNGWWEELEFTLPTDGAWRHVLDTYAGTIEPTGPPAATAVRVGPRSLVLLVRPRAA